MPRAPATPVLLLAVLLPGVLLPAVHASAENQRYELDPVHTRILVAVGHAGFSQALGTVSGSTGTLEFDPADWSTARIEAMVPLARLDFGDEGWNKATLGRRLLRVQTYPEARFVSTAVTPRDARHATVCGNLTLHGMSQPLCLDVVLNALARHPMPPFRETAGFSATGRLDRRHFGIEAWEGVVGYEVELRIEAEAVRRRDDGEAAPAPEPSGSDPDTPPHPPAADARTSPP
jgi:polyisoprenoid-binding protein YceI